jgi:glycosyltransferase involved in cell wall biosynthesis
MSKGKILWLSDSPLTVTGYATISRNICNGLKKKGWDILYMGHNYLGQPLMNPIFEDGEGCNFKLTGMGVEPYCKDLIVPRLREFKPDIFCTLLDTFMVFPWFMQMDFAPAKSVFYFPSDGGGQLPQGCENILRRMTKSVAMAKFGQQQCKEYYNLDTEYIPHAVDTNIFYRLSEEERNKARHKWGFQDKFVVGVVARNQGRKMLDRTLKTFKIFCKDKQNAILFMHTDPYDRAGVFDMTAMIQREGLQNRVVFSGMNFFKGFDYKQMNEVYNIMDVFLLTTSGEGFGVPIIEAMACEVPVIATDYTTTPELVTEHNAGFGAKLAAEITGSWNVERGVMDDNDCSDKLTILYKDRELCKTMGKNGRKAVDTYYSWDVVIEQWDKFFTELKDAI